MNTTLPAGFAALEPFVARWAISGTASRDALRSESSDEERAAFFNAAKDLAAEGLALLDKKSPQEFDDAETRLMNLLLSFTHVSLAVEVLGKAEARHAQFRSAMKITRSAAGA